MLRMGRRISHSHKRTSSRNEWFRMLAAQAAQQFTDALVDQAFDKLARLSCSMDLAVAGEWQKLASIVRSLWRNTHAQAVERQHLG